MSVLMIYAEKGETVTCTNGHPICDFAETVPYGRPMNLPKELTNWRQEPPVVGELDVRCAQCGAPFYDFGRFHIGQSWRPPVHPTEHP